MKHLLTRAYARQRLISWQRFTWRKALEFGNDVSLALFYFLLLAALALVTLTKG